MIQVSVVIPVYNIEAHLEECLASVCAQTLRDIEVICVDDGSTDASPDILSRFAAMDKRFRIVTQENAGPGAARNAGLELAQGEYIVFLDSDDWFEAGFLEQMICRARQTGADITICRSQEFDTKTGEAHPSEWMLKEYLLPNDCFAPQEARRHLFQFTYGWAWDKLYRMEFVRQKGLVFPALPNSEDLVFVFQSLAMAERIALVGRTLIHHRMNRAGSVSNSRMRSPETPAQSLSMLQGALKRRGLYDTYEQSFLNWAMEFLIWNVANMGEARAQRRYFEKLRREWLPQMAFDAHPRDYYDNRFAYAKYILVRYVPYGVFCIVLSVYKAGKRLALRSENAA